jgi:TatD family-associated radical SAM protein
MNEPGVIAYHGKDNIYLNVTNRCTCACTFCLREFTDEVYGYPLLLDREPSVEQITQALELEFLEGPADEVVFCGLGEPTLRLPEVLEVTDWLRLRRIPARLNTNGLGQLANPDVEVVPALVQAGLSGVSVSLNAADPETYDRLCRPIYAKAFRAVLAFTRGCVAAGLDTTMTVVDHPDVDIEACAAIAAGLGAAFRVRGCAVRRHPPASQATAASAGGPTCSSPTTGD